MINGNRDMPNEYPKKEGYYWLMYGGEWQVVEVWGLEDEFVPKKEGQVMCFYTGGHVCNTHDYRAFDWRGPIIKPDTPYTFDDCPFCGNKSRKKCPKCCHYGALLANNTLDYVYKSWCDDALFRFASGEYEHLPNEEERERIFGIMGLVHSIFKGLHPSISVLEFLEMGVKE